LKLDTDMYQIYEHTEKRASIVIKINGIKSKKKNKYGNDSRLSTAVRWY